jgi:hypothetical protein
MASGTQRGGRWAASEVDALSSEEEDAPLLADEAGPGKLERGASASSSSGAVLGETTLLVQVRHSRVYFWLTVVQLLLISATLAWYAADPHGSVRHGGFVLLELLITVALAFDTLLQMDQQGGLGAFFCNSGRGEEPVQAEVVRDAARVANPNQDDGAAGAAALASPPPLPADGERDDEGSCSPVARCGARYGQLVLNYLQVLLLALCMLAFVGTASRWTSGVWQEDSVLGLMLARYAILLAVFAWRQYRTVALQGGLRKAFGVAEPVDKEWDVSFK